MNSKGFLIYAFDNENTEYGKLADICSILIKYWLGKDSVVVKDKETIVKSSFYKDIIIVDPISKTSEWRNQDRANYFDLSPFEETIVIDSDYLLFNDKFNNFFGSKESLILSKDAIQFNGQDILENERRLSSKSIDMIWATCFYFKKDNKAKEFFDLVNKIKKTYPYYYHLYNVSESKYRNDYVFSLAWHITNKQESNSRIMINPFSIVTSYNSVEIEKLNSNGLVLSDIIGSDGLYEIKKDTLHNLPNISVHMLNKTTILDFYDKFIELFS